MGWDFEVFYRASDVPFSVSFFRLFFRLTANLDATAASFGSVIRRSCHRRTHIFDRSPPTQSAVNIFVREAEDTNSTC